MRSSDEATRLSAEQLGDRKGYAEAIPETVELARQLQAEGLSCRKISAALAERGHVTGSGKLHAASAIRAGSLEQSRPQWAPGIIVTLFPRSPLSGAVELSPGGRIPPRFLVGCHHGG
jgi:hypothetical protein